MSEHHQGENDGVETPLTEQELNDLRHAATLAHGNGVDGRAVELSQQGVIAVVRRIVAAARRAPGVSGRTPDCLPFCEGGWHESTCVVVADQVISSGEGASS